MPGESGWLPSSTVGIQEKVLNTGSEQSYLDDSRSRGCYASQCLRQTAFANVTHLTDYTISAPNTRGSRSKPRNASRVRRQMRGPIVAKRVLFLEMAQGPEAIAIPRRLRCIPGRCENLAQEVIVTVFFPEVPFKACQTSDVCWAGFTKDFFRQLRSRRPLRLGFSTAGVGCATGWTLRKWFLDA